MYKEEFSFPSSEEGETIRGRIYLPYSRVHGVVQFAHGMCDYGSRYEDFFKVLTDCGYAAAYADHLGHGLSVQNLDDLGYFSAKQGYLKVVDDFSRFYDIVDEEIHSEKHYVWGHSMGSFVVRYFMATCRKNMAGAVLMGTSGPNPLAGVGAGIAELLALTKGGYHRSEFISKLAFGTYNRKIEDPRSPWAWLSRDDDAVDSFSSDKFRNRTFTAAGFRDMFSMVRYVNRHSFLENTPKELPVLLLSGEEDPLGNYGKGILRLEDMFRSAGMEDVETVLFPEARHELCHELNREEVYKTFIHWLDEHEKTDIRLTFAEDPFDFDDEYEDEYDDEYDDDDEEREYE